jgi:phosphate transport system substrate-binding protein
MIIASIMRNGRMLAMLLCALAALSTIISCTEEEDPTSGRITVVGSESVWRAMDDEAREFMTMYGKATVRAVGIGSVAGLKEMFEAPRPKDTVLAVSTRPLFEAERAAAIKNGFEPKEFKVALDGIAIIVNAANPVESLTVDQVRDVFSGRIRNWCELGGPDLAIKVMFGQPNSATYQQLRDSVLHDAGLAASTRHFDSMYAIIRAVQNDKAAIGYCGSSYLYRDWLAKPPYPEPNIRALALARTAAGPVGAGSLFVPPDPGTIYDKSYPLWRYIYLIARREPKGAVGGFITFVMSSKGQQVLVRDGLAPATVKFIVNREGE